MMELIIFYAARITKALFGKRLHYLNPKSSANFGLNWAGYVG
jgi:hypothetical protein